MQNSTATISVDTQATEHLKITNLTKVYPGQHVPAVDNVSLTLGQGQMLALLGPSGCGKTTTLRMLAGLIEATDGEVVVSGKNLSDVPVHKRGMGMVFQSYALFPHLNVFRNVAFGLEMRKVPQSERADRVTEALDMVQLGHLAQRRVKELSGGQQQRVALARALVVEPSLLLLDEPLSNLDAKLRDAMRAEIRSIVHRLGVTTVFVTHDQDEALSMADQIAVMKDGKVEQVGSPEEIYQRPASRFIADFIGRANLVAGTVSHSDGATASIEVDGLGEIATSHSRNDLTKGREVTVLIRPHSIQVSKSSTQGAFQGRVIDRSYTGEMESYVIKAGDHELSAESLTGLEASSAPGEDVWVSWMAGDAVLLPASADQGTRE